MGIFRKKGTKRYEDLRRHNLNIYGTNDPEKIKKIIARRKKTGRSYAQSTEDLVNAFNKGAKRYNKIKKKFKKFWR
jgi:hypothetical protein